MSQITTPNKATGEQHTAAEYNAFKAAINDNDTNITTESAARIDADNALATAVGLKLDASAYNDRFKGKYISKAALDTAHPTGADGQYAHVDSGSGSNAQEYIWDTQAGWVLATSSTVTSTDVVAEGSTNLYFSETRVRAALLTAISFVSAIAVTATDSFLVGMGKLQAQITDIYTKLLGKKNALTRAAVATAGFTAAANTYYPIDSTTILVPVVLPPTPADKTLVSLKLIAGSLGFSITCGGAAVFNKAGGSTVLTVTVLNQSMNLEYDSTTDIWTVISGDLSVAQLDARYTAKIVPAPALSTDAANKQFVLDNKVDATQYGNSPFFEYEDGLYQPILKQEGMSNSTGLANHASGGVVAAVAGTQGSGDIYLPKAIDMTKPWRCAVLVEINDAQTIDELAFYDASGNANCGIRFTVISTARMSGALCGSTSFCPGVGLASGIPAGTKVWIGMAYDGANYVQGFVMPDNPDYYMNDISGSSIPTTNGSWDNRAWAVTALPNATSSGIKCFGGTGADFKYSLCKFTLKTKSTQNRVVGIFWNQGLGGPKDGQLLPPAMLRFKALNDESGWAILPGTLSYQQTDIIQAMHPNANPGTFGFTNGAANYTELAKIVKAGYLVFGINGCDAIADYDKATGSNWGAAAGNKYRKAATDWIRANIPATRKLFVLGQSMGVLNAVRYAIEFPNQVKGIVGISGALDLLDCYTNRGFPITIQKAHGTWYQCLLASTGVQPDQVVNVSAIANISDTTITVTALSNRIPSGTILTFQSGTGQATVVTTAPAAAGATSIAVTTLTVAIAVSTKYNMSAHYQQISTGFGAPAIVFYTDSYVWKDLLSVVTVSATAASGATSITVSALPVSIPSGSVLAIKTGTGVATVTTTAAVSSSATSIPVSALGSGITSGAVYDIQYSVNDIILISNPNTVNFYRYVDPTLNVSSLKFIQFKEWHGDADTLIPIAQATNFVAALNAAGGSASLVTITGGTHLSNSCYDGAAIVSFLNSIP